MFLSLTRGSGWVPAQLFWRLRRRFLEWRLARARRKNAALRTEAGEEIRNRIAPTPFAHKSVTQLRKLARRGHRRGYERVAATAERELSRRLLVGGIRRPEK